MALDDRDKLAIVRIKFINKLKSFQTWEDFKVFLQGVTKVQIKTFIQNALSAEQGNDAAHIILLGEKSSDYDALKSEIDAL